jgi:hypothetical protein
MNHSLASPPLGSIPACLVTSEALNNDDVTNVALASGVRIVASPSSLNSRGGFNHLFTPLLFQLSLLPVGKPASDSRLAHYNVSQSERVLIIANTSSPDALDVSSCVVTHFIAKN